MLQSVEKKEFEVDHAALENRKLMQRKLIDGYNNNNQRDKEQPNEMIQINPRITFYEIILLNSKLRTN